MHDWTSLCKKLKGLASYRFDKSGILQWRDTPDKEWSAFTHLDRRLFMQILGVREWSIIHQSIVWLAEKRRQLR